MITFDTLVNQALAVHSEPRAVVGDILVRYCTDPQARLALNRWLTMQLENEVERRTRQ